MKRSALRQMGEQTLAEKGYLWMCNLIENRAECNFKPSAYDLLGAHKGERAIVFAAGAHDKWDAKGHLEQVYSAPKRPLVIATDNSLPTFAEHGYVPDYVVSVDGSCLIAKYFHPELKGKPEGVLLLTLTHPATLEVIRRKSWKTYWWQSSSIRMKQLSVKGLVGTSTGGNVGTSAVILALFLLGCKPVGLLDIEFAWSDEIPYREEGKRFKRAGYELVKNPHTDSRYMADQTYYLYGEWFVDAMKQLKPKHRRHLFCLTKEGIIYKSGIKYQPLQDFINNKKTV